MSLIHHVLPPQQRWHPANILGKISRRLGEWILSLSGVTGVWIDVGAHRGETSFWAAHRNPRLIVYAFEPQLEVIKAVMGRVANFIVMPFAIAEVEGNQDFYINQYSAASSLLPMDPDALAQWKEGDLLSTVTKRLVPTIRLDTFLNRCGISEVDFLKIDAQGADLAVLRSAGNRLTDVKRILIEVPTVRNPLYQGGASKQDVLDYLTAHDFTCIATESQANDQEENMLFVRKEAAA